jgi:hypothetical protein
MKIKVSSYLLQNIDGDNIDNLKNHRSQELDV